MLTGKEVPYDTLVDKDIVITIGARRKTCVKVTHEATSRKINYSPMDLK